MAADAARVWLLAGVRPTVAAQVLRPRELLAAEVALADEPRRVRARGGARVVVPPPVHRQLERRREDALAHLTQRRSDISLNMSHIYNLRDAKNRRTIAVTVIDLYKFKRLYELLVRIIEKVSSRSITLLCVPTARGFSHSC